LLAVRDARIDPLLAQAGSLPAGLVDVLRRGLAREPSDRHATAAELRAALLPFLDGPPAALRAELGSVVAVAVGERKADDAALRTPPPEDEVTREPPLDDYLVITATGARLGPLTFAQLVEAVTMGRISRDDSVSVAGAQPRVLRDIPELVGHFPARGPSLSAASDRRSMAGGGIVDALASSAARELTGVWVCTCGDARKEVYLIEGAPEFVASNLASELLGEFLVARGLLERGELDMALAVLPRFDGRLGDTLAALGLIAPVELFRHISDQVREKLLELFTWPEGEARFHEGVAPPQRYFPLGLDPWRVISQGIERRLAQGLEQDTFAAHMMDSLERTATRAPEGLPSGVEGVIGETRQPIQLQDLVDLLEVGDRDVHRPYRAIRLALALDLVRWV
jgi:serine/threonine-protein kinase